MELRYLRREFNLNARQARYVLEYLVDHNQTQAAIRAGYSARTARRTASQIMTKQDIAAAVEWASQQMAEKVEVTAEQVWRQTAVHAFSTIRDVVEIRGGKPVLRDNIPDHALDAVTELRETIHGLQIKMEPRHPSLNLLAKMLQLIPERGTPDEPIHHDVTLREEHIDPSRLTDVEARQLLDQLEAIIIAGEIATEGDPQRTEG